MSDQKKPLLTNQEIVYLFLFLLFFSMIYPFGFISVFNESQNYFIYSPSSLVEFNQERNDGTFLCFALIPVTVTLVTIVSIIFTTHQSTKWLAWLIGCGVFILYVIAYITILAIAILYHFNPSF